MSAEHLQDQWYALQRSTGLLSRSRILGILYDELLRYTQALKLDPTYESARINLGNLLFLKKDYPAALARFQDAWREIERRGEGGSAKRLKVLLNISKTCYQMARYPEAQEYYAKAQAIDPQQAKQFAYLAEWRSDETRVVEERDLAYEVLFREDL